VSQLIISFVNIFLFGFSVSVYLRKAVPAFPGFLRGFVSAISTLVILSFLYFLILVLNQGFTFLLILLSVINIIFLYWTYTGLKKIFNYKYYAKNYNEAIIPLLAILVMTLVFVFHGSKYGDYDSWAIWNVHAKFLFYPQVWTRISGDGLVTSHADYPLMLPCLVAFFWKTINNETFIIPLLLSFSILLAITLLLYYALLDEFKSNLFAYFGLFILVADYNFQLLDSAQCADTLISLFILLAFVLNNRLKNNPSTHIAYILGFICADCTWIKNEGDLFYLVFTAVFIVSNYKHVSNIFKYLIGSIVPLFVTIYYKIIFAPTNDLVSASNHQTQRLLHDLKDVNRYSVIFKFFEKTLLQNFLPAIVLILVLLIFNRSFFKSFAFIVFFILISGFTVIYLITPYNLEWHLATSLSRILYQIYPSFLYTSIIAYAGYQNGRLNFQL